MTIDGFITQFKEAMNFTNSEEIGQIIVDDIKRHILASRSIDDVAYPPLAPSTLEVKRSKGYPLQPLVGSGKLLGSISYSKDSNLSIIVSVEYASYLQTKYNYIGLSKDGLKDIEKLIQRRLDRIR